MKQVKAFPRLHVLHIHSTRYGASVTVKAVTKFGVGYGVSVLNIRIFRNF